MSSSLRIEEEIIIGADSAEVFENLITPTDIGEWWNADSVIVTPEKGGVWILSRGPDEDELDFVISGRIQIIDSPNHLQLQELYCLRGSESSAGDPDMFCQFELESLQNGTKLRFTHGGIASKSSFDQFFIIWKEIWKNSLSSLKTYSESTTESGAEPEKVYPFEDSDDVSEAWKTFYQALTDCDPGILNQALQQGLDVNDDSGPEGRPIMQLANFGINQLIEPLLQKGAEVNYPTSTGGTPLHVAASQGYTNTVRLLLAHGADSNAATIAGADGQGFWCPCRGETPLHLAAAYGDLEMIEALASAGADFSVKDALGARPIDYYRRHRNEERDGRGIRDFLLSRQSTRKQ